MLLLLPLTNRSFAGALPTLQLGYALKQGIPYLVLFGESEVEAGVVKIKDLDANTEETVAEVGCPAFQCLLVSCGRNMEAEGG